MDSCWSPIEKFYEALKAPGNKPEAHIYRAGEHGFGMKKQGTTSDHWIEEFYWWLEAQGLAPNVWEVRTKSHARCPLTYHDLGLHCGITKFKPYHPEE